MKNFIPVFPLLLFALSLCFISCKDEDVLPPTDEHEILGEWSMTNVSGGFAGINDPIEKGAYIWTFGESQVNLHITELIPTGYGFSPGNYDYSIISVDEKEFLVIDGDEVGEIQFIDEEMTLDGNSFSNASGADGFMYGFER